MNAYVCLGSNLGNSEEQLQTALQSILQLDGVRLVAKSTVYWTEPQGVKDQPWFANQVICVFCAPRVTPEGLLADFLEIESEMGRIRDSDPTLRFGPRCIDIDLLMFDGATLRTKHCTLPHPRMQQRAFVLVPLREVLTQDMLLDGFNVDTCLAQLNYRVEGQKIYQST